MPQQFKERLEAIDAYHLLTNGKQTESVIQSEQDNLPVYNAVVGKGRLELPRLAAHDPKSGWASFTLFLTVPAWLV